MKIINAATLLAGSMIITSSFNLAASSSNSSHFMTLEAQKSINTTHSENIRTIKVSLSKNINQTKLTHFIETFATHYEEGDLTQFMALFAENAETNDASDKMAIKKDYGALFNATEMRVIDMQGLQWRIKRNIAKGSGDFNVTVLHLGGQKMKSFSGKIALEIKINKGHLELTKLFHAYSGTE